MHPFLVVLFFAILVLIFLYLIHTQQKKAVLFLIRSDPKVLENYQKNG